MNANTFVLKSTAQNIDVQPNEIDGSFDGHSSYLHFSINLKFRPESRLQAFDVLSITARLLLINGTQLSEVIIHPNIAVNGECWYIEALKFKLTKETLEYIEQKRRGDLELKIELNFQVLLRRSGGIDETIKMVDGIWVGKTHLQPVIPKSIWAEKILKNLGYKSFVLIEVPVHHDVLEEAFPAF